MEKDNMLIAEFMGIHEIMLDEYSNYEIDDIYQILGIEPHHHKGLIIHESDLQFHKSWDWLMPVVEKIEQVHQGVPRQLIDLSLHSYISEVYAGAVEYIKDYLKNNLDN